MEITVEDARRILRWLDDTDMTDEVCMPSIRECWGAFTSSNKDCQLCQKLQTFLVEQEAEKQ